MHKSFILTVLTLPIFTLSISTTQAKELAIEPGLWKTETTVYNSIIKETNTETTEECITESTYTLEKLTEDYQECSILSEDISDNSLTYKMICNSAGTQFTLDGKLSIDGDKGEGTMDIKVSAEGMEFELNSNWITQRISNC